MTENQRKLMPYVEARVNDIITDKESRRIAPALATEPEIIADVHTDVMECMRELHRDEKYQATTTLNHPALKKINHD